MQSAEGKPNKSSLLVSLRRYASAVRNMEETILLPSLLRDVPSEDESDCDAAEESCTDLYDNYLMLKAISYTMESGLISSDNHKAMKNGALHKSVEPLVGKDPEALFYFHLKGLFSVLSDLTKKTHHLTEKYMDIVGATS
ncbi:mid1-interacting protein 1-B-like [Takifugu flavidus]|nr:mid1-interacting protein 1-B-like [Takifugu flavidus]TWW76883.1 Mid1-interacting protein 1-B [Takifugu flavidus]